MKGVAKERFGIQHVVGLWQMTITLMHNGA